MPSRDLGFNILFEASTTKAERAIASFTRAFPKRIAAAVNSLPDIQLDANSTAADRRIADIRRQLQALGDKKIGIDIDATAAQAQMRRLQDELRDLGSKSRDVKVRADTAAASAALGSLERQATRLDNKNVTMTARVDGDRALTMIGLITAGLATIGAAAPAAVAGLAAVGATGAAAAQGIGTLAAGFSGVGDAVKALSAEETKAASTSAAAGASRVATQQRIAAAVRSLEQAQIQADRAAITGAQQVRDAERARFDAHISGARQVAAAMQDLAQAQERERQAQQDLTRAWKEGQEQLEDFALTLRGAVLDEEEAVDRLEEARQRLAEAQAQGAGAEEIDDLTRAVRRAELGVDQARERMGDLRAEQAEWARTGVAGSDAVTAAQRRAADASQGVRDAEIALFHARQDQRRQNEEADIAVDRARQQAAWAQQDAARQVIDAQRQLAEAMVETGTAGAAAANKVAEAMGKLSPAGQSFARMLHGEVLPALRGIRDRIQETMLPHMEQALRNMLPVVPIFAEGLAETGDMIGRLAVRGSEMMSSGPWREDFRTILAANNRLIGDYGNAGLELADAFRSITVAGIPLAERLSQAALRGADMFNSFIQTSRATGELDRFMQAAGNTLFEIGETLVQVAVGASQLALALGPVGGILLDVVGKLAEMIGNFAEAHPVITQWVGGLALATIAVTKLGTVVTGLVATSGAASAGLRTLGSAMALIVPANLETKLATTAGLIDAKGAALNRASGKAGGFLTTLTRVGSYLPAIGLALGAAAIAFETFTVQSDEAAQSLLDGGVAADHMRTKIAAQQGAADAMIGVFPALSGAIRLFAADQDSANAAAQRLYNSLTPLGQAQQQVTWYTNQHAEAVKAWGPNSSQAAVAAGALAAAQTNLEVQQRAAGDATKSHTDRLVEQQNQMLASVNAEVAMRQSTLALEQSQRSLSQAVDQYGIDSFEAREAGVAYEQALLRNVTAIGENARQQAILRGETDPTRFAIDAQRQAVEGLIAQAGGNAPPALVRLAEGMRNSAGQASSAAMNVAGLNQRIAEMPPGRNVNITADTRMAQEEIDRFLSRNAQHVIRMTAQADVGNITAGARPRRRGGVDDPAGMAAGGIRTMARDVAQVVPPNQPVLMGDRMQGREYFLPDDNSARTMAVGQQWAADRGLRLVPMQAGGMLGVARPVTQPGQAGLDSIAGQRGGAQLPTDPRSADNLSDSLQNLIKRALTPLSRILNDDTIPALLSTGEHHQQLAQNVLTATTGMQGSTDQLREFTNTAWLNMQEQTGLQVTTTLGTHFLALTTGHRNTELSTQALQLWSNASWLDMQVQTGTNIGLITGPHFGTLALGHRNTEASQTAMQNLSNTSWANITATTGANVGQITGPIFGGLHAGMTGVEQHGVTMADGWTMQLNRLRAAAADPIRWIMQWPLGPPGIAASWNILDDQFKLGKRVHPPAPGFAGGGSIFSGMVRGPGTGTSDSIPAVTENGDPLRVSTKEFIVRESVASRVPHFLNALNAGQTEAFQAAGGTGATMPGFAGGGLVRAQEWARGQAGKRYVWGGVGPGGYDCSGWLGAITNVLRGQAPHRRIGTTATFPWGGFQGGLRGAWSIGAFKGNPGHMAGTLGGVNVEAGGRHNTNAYGGPAVGADHRQFNIHGFLPEVGGVFAPGGAGGGGIDPGPVVEDAFRRAYELVNDVTRWFGDSAYSTGSQGVARQTVDAVKAKALEAVAAAAGASGEPPGAGVERWRPLVHRMLALVGQPQTHDNVTLRRMQQESGGNPRAINNWDVNAKRGTPSKGLMQVIDPTFRAHRHPSLPDDIWDPGANVAASMRYALNRYGSLPAAYNRRGGYDIGGDWPSNTWGWNGSGQTEHVLRGPERAAFLELVDVIRHPRALGQTAGGDTFIVQTSAQATAPQIIGEAVHAAKVRRHRGKYGR